MTSGVSQGVSQKGKSRKLPPFLSFLKVEIPYKDGMEEVVGSNPICSTKANEPCKMERPHKTLCLHRADYVVSPFYRANARDEAGREASCESHGSCNYQGECP